MIQIGDLTAPATPVQLDETGIDRAVLIDLTLKLAYTTTQFSTEWAARQLHLSLPVIAELLQQLTNEQMVQVLGQTGPFNYRYTISARGRERAQRLFEVSGYVGPAPVSLESYTAMLDWQMAHAPKASLERVREVLSELVLSDEAVQLAGLALSSWRSLFLFGPSGNGKTSLARMLHNAMSGDLWIPHCIGVESNIIRVFDPRCHHVVESPIEGSARIDPRWVRIRRPMIVVGGELTIHSLDLAYSSSLRYYEAPLHFKSNGGIFLIDDFGRQRVDPHQLLNRWIIPLEHQIDHLAFHTGQKITVPFRQMLIFATNLNPEEVTDPAFLRRMGYRLQLSKPTAERYAQIFQRYAASVGQPVEPGVITRILQRYQSEKRELRCCEPRDLIERVLDLSRFRARQPELNDELLNLAWTGYFGDKQQA
jgi:predicted ATPase with chaperone activity